MGGLQVVLGADCLTAFLEEVPHQEQLSQFRATQRGLRREAYLLQGERPCLVVHCLQENPQRMAVGHMVGL